MKINKLPKELRLLVREVTDLWGDIIQEEAGLEVYKLVESLRKSLKKFRDKSSLSQEISALRKIQQTLEGLPVSSLEDITHSFSILLELINTCENAVRSQKIKIKAPLRKRAISGFETYLVLTAHPTESRAPEMVEVLQQVQTHIYDYGKLKPLLRSLWHLRMAREQKPQVKDEAEYIYSILFRPEVLEVLFKEKNRNVFLRTWVGGDKDGHPGVNAQVMLQSLGLSRSKIIKYLDFHFKKTKSDLEGFSALSRRDSKSDIDSSLAALELIFADLEKLDGVQKNDSLKVAALKSQMSIFEKGLSLSLRRRLPAYSKACNLIRIFPSLVVPLELRESSEVFREKPEGTLIFEMLKTLKEISNGTDPRGYARGLIISMCQSFKDLENAWAFLELALGKAPVLPLIPLFEQAEDLRNGPEISQKWIQSRNFKKFEVMLGYSDSSKEAGVLPSRLEIRSALNSFEQLSKKNPGLRLTYFHGSGGSVARGGGSLEEQTAHWPRAAFERYKVTLQGEMIQRTFSTQEIFEQYLDKVQSLGLGKSLKSSSKNSKVLLDFSEQISNFYRTSISDPRFLNMVEDASAYRFLEELQFGSRPSKRKKLEGISSLRAIPWILAWTQTRSLLPTWWGFGNAYSKMTVKQKAELSRLGRGQDPLFVSFLHQLGFTIAKIQPAIWHLYLEQSELSAEDKKYFFESFLLELKLTKLALKKITGKNDALWSKPWLKESILLRSPLIHPLNIAQLIAWKNGYTSLLREASVGIACGMLTTG